MLGAELDGRSVTALALGPFAPTDMLRELTESTEMSPEQRAAFLALHDTAAPGLLLASLQLFRSMVSDELDHANGRHLDANRPLAEQLDG